MEFDILSKIYVVQHSSGIYLKFTVKKADAKELPIGAVNFNEQETMRLYAALRAYFERLELPEYMIVKDIRPVMAAQAKPPVPKLPLTTAQEIQNENLRREANYKQVEEEKKIESEPVDLLKQMEKMKREKEAVE